MASVDEGNDKNRYYTPSVAARLIHRSRHEVAGLIKKGLLQANYDKNVIAEVAGPGRPPNFVIEADGVDRLRHELLTDLGVDAELAELRQAQEQLHERLERDTLALRGRVAELDERLASALRAIELRLEASSAQIRADQEFIRALRLQTAIDTGA